MGGKAEAKADGGPESVDREVFSPYEVDDENQGPLLAANLRGVTADTEDDGFVESNLMHSINGYVYGNGPVLQLKKGQRVRWYVMARVLPDLGVTRVIEMPPGHVLSTLIAGATTGIDIRTA